MNNHPLGYLEEDVQLPTLTPNSLLLVNCNILPELAPYHLREKDLRKRAKFLQRTKDAIWHRWTSEYVRALRERHRLKHSNSKNPFSEGDVVIIKSEERNRHFWPLGVIEKLILGRDGVTRAAKVQSRKTVLERAIQHLYRLNFRVTGHRRTGRRRKRSILAHHPSVLGRRSSCGSVTQP